MTLTKADLIHKVYEQHQLTKAQAAETVELFLDIAKKSLQEGDGLLISGFGKFNIKQKQARRGRNPQTGEEMILAPRKVVTFKPSGQLRKLVNGKD